MLRKELKFRVIRQFEDPLKYVLPVAAPLRRKLAVKENKAVSIMK